MTGDETSPRSAHGPALRVAFDQRLTRLDDAFVGAGLVIVSAMPRLTDAFMNSDTTAIEEARSMAADVDARIREVEDAGFLLLAREAPVGRDLRRLVALLRLTHDIERSAHLLRHVVECAEQLDARTLPEVVRQQVQELASRSTEVFRAGIDAWRNRDGNALAEVDALDDEIDALQVALLESAAANQVDVGTAMMVLGLIGRYLERIADHGVALARDVTFVVTGERVTASSS